LGNRLHESYDSRWSDGFPLRPGVVFKDLYVYIGSQRITYNIGIFARACRGIFKRSLVAAFSSDHQSSSHFLNVEIVLNGAVYYVNFNDADLFPSPIRLENHTDVPVNFHQTGCNEQFMQSVLEPHSEKPYAWDDPLLRQCLVLNVYDSPAVTYDLTTLGQNEPLTYENYFHIVVVSRTGVDNSKPEFALEAFSTGNVVLQPMDKDARRQLWRLTSDNILVNIGVTERTQACLRATSDVYCLDFDYHSQQNRHMVILKKLSASHNDPISKWQFDKDGVLSCLTIKSRFRANSMVSGSKVMLEELPADEEANEGLVAGSPCEIEQFIRRRQKSGSGYLTVNIALDGPARVLRIADKDRPDHCLTASTIVDSSTLLITSSTTTDRPFSLSCIITLQCLGVSVIDSETEELVFGVMNGVLLSGHFCDGKYNMGITVVEIQVIFVASCTGFSRSFNEY
ncbi:unnamed protein product, partial [Soboliphyme baturini]|uniref:Ricin B-type lectin domain-containing protein n=1 Tax=Soboliphyme baturini TaxID=241478 RepID=A0A183J880_9BILA